MNLKKKLKNIIHFHIARISYEANRAFCESLGDFSQPKWKNAPRWRKESIVEGVSVYLSNRCTPSESHNNWVKEKIKNGWKYGKDENLEKKEHPWIVPFDELPKKEQFSIVLFITIVNSY